MSTYGLDDKINKLASKTPSRPLGHPLCMDGLGVFIVNLWLSAQGIWYYRKMTLLPCGHFRIKPVVAQPEPQPNSLSESQQPQQQRQSAANPALQSALMAPSAISSPVLSELSERDLKEKALFWAPKALSNQKN